MTTLTARQRAHNDHALVVVVAAIAAAAWLALSLPGQGGHAAHHQHHGSGETQYAVNAIAFTASWTLMTIAMMLPTMLPVLRLFNRIVRQHASRHVLVALAATGYVAIWMIVGIGAHAAMTGLGRLAGVSGWVAARQDLVGPAILLLAGAFQFTALKHRCLDKCRSPFSVVVEHWRGERERRNAFTLGVSHGLFCLGCCWALMLLMFVSGVGGLVWMLAIAGIMAIEKNASWGRRVSAPVGYTLIAMALITFARSL